MGWGEPLQPRPHPAGGVVVEVAAAEHLAAVEAENARFLALLARALPHIDPNGHHADFLLVVDIEDALDAQRAPSSASRPGLVAAGAGQPAPSREGPHDADVAAPVRTAEGTLPAPDDHPTPPRCLP